MDPVADGHAVGVAGVLDLDHLPLARQVRPVEPLGDHPVQAGALERVQPLRALLGVLGGAGDVAPLLLVHRIGQRFAPDPERLLQQRRVAGGQRVEADEMRGRLLGQHLDPARGGMDALRQRLPVQPDAAADLPRDHDLAVEHAARRQLVTQRLLQLREVAAELLAVA